VLAYVYPAMSVFWSMLWFFCFFIWIMLLFRVFADLFRSHDLGGGGKALWVIFVVIVPFLGVLVYLIARGHGMAERNMTDAANQQQALDEYVRKTAGTSSADQLATLAELHDQGKLSDEDFAKAKAKVIG